MPWAKNGRPRTTCVVGVQWGDEGKGKIVDLLSAKADVVVRFQGGGNAGHTVVVGGEKFVLHLVPSGILHRGSTSVIANGVVVDPVQLVEEIEHLRGRGVNVGRNLLVSERAHVVMPYHKLQDELSEGNGERKLGTTRRGIGPCYADKAARKGIRIADLYKPDRFRQGLAALVEEKNRVLGALYGAPPLEAEKIFNDYRGYAEKIRPFVGDALEFVNAAIDRGKRVLFEGAQGSLLDIDFGTYPYVTSSNSDACGIPAGAGVPPKKVRQILGVAKAYCTRVGEGPFPTELNDDIGERLRSAGREYGSTTGRPRRCGWFDAVTSRHAVMINGIDGLVITKLDVLDTFDRIRVCMAYRLDGRRVGKVPVDSQDLARCVPVYETFPGWNADTSQAKSFSDLPRAARRYLTFLERTLGVPVVMISVGTDREKTIRR
ncbi:MAG: adenylosuccinate synthase [Planctomycetes bacterium]|nr:adenylosuccinate synthase [Planctomycetota bacterium]